MFCEEIFYCQPSGSHVAGSWCVCYQTTSDSPCIQLPNLSGNCIQCGNWLVSSRQLILATAGRVSGQVTVAFFSPPSMFTEWLLFHWILSSLQANVLLTFCLLAFKMTVVSLHLSYNTYLVAITVTVMMICPIVSRKCYFGDPTNQNTTQGFKSLMWSM